MRSLDHQSNALTTIWADAFTLVSQLEIAEGHESKHSKYSQDYTKKCHELLKKKDYLGLNCIWREPS